ncbi:hypothetical protein ACTID9_00645 [Brevibacillus fluminis]|uniref:hypothetical protein n=1 Tax=Brevibacillus fluminis TaxID=511487 RepID=UPI003F8B1D5C
MFDKVATIFGVKPQYAACTDEGFKKWVDKCMPNTYCSKTMKRTVQIDSRNGEICKEGAWLGNCC